MAHPLYPYRIMKRLFKRTKLLFFYPWTGWSITLSTIISLSALQVKFERPDEVQPQVSTSVCLCANVCVCVCACMCVFMCVCLEWGLVLVALANSNRAIPYQLETLNAFDSVPCLVWYVQLMLPSSPLTGSNGYSYSSRQVVVWLCRDNCSPFEQSWHGHSVAVVLNGSAGGV